jgi:uncharacterized protein YqcC (DUF446 family)
MTTMADQAKIAAAFAAICEEMKRTGVWNIARPADDAFDDMGAFGMKTMAFEQWLRWVFVPRVEGSLAAGGPWPASSEIAAHATRELDGVLELAELVRLLGDFDVLF